MTNNNIIIRLQILLVIYEMSSYFYPFCQGRMGMGVGFKENIKGDVWQRAVLYRVESKIKIIL